MRITSDQCARIESDQYRWDLWKPSGRGSRRNINLGSFSLVFSLMSGSVSIKTRGSPVRLDTPLVTEQGLMNHVKLKQIKYELASSKASGGKTQISMVPILPQL